MTRRPVAHAHEWLALVEMSGLVISEPVLHASFPQGPEAVPRRLRRRLLGAWERLQVDPADTARRGIWRETLLFELLAWPRERYRGSRELPDTALVRPDDLEETLRPAGVLEDDGGHLLLGLWTVPAAQRFDRVERRSGRWRATPQVKLERWMRGTGVALGLLTNGRQLRLVHVPLGLPAAWLDFEAALFFDEAQVLDGFATLLAGERFFGPPERRLERLVADSQERQTELTDALGGQVRRAVELLLLALDEADHAQAAPRGGGRRLLAPLTSEAIYRAAVYAVMRLVFLLFAEERQLLPHGNVFYDEGYGLGRLLHRLEEERRERSDTFEREADAWPRLLALFRLVFHGGRHPDLALPAYGGDLFDPAGFDAMAVLERPELRLPNAAVYQILRALTFGEVRVGRETLSQRYSYRTLDVEHIGYLYEGLLDHRAARAGAEPRVKLRNGSEEAHRLPALEALAGDALVSFLAGEGVFSGDEERIAAHLADPPAEELEALAAAALPAAVAERCRPFAGVIQLDEVIEPGRLHLTTSVSRRATGTHYTPIQYTRAMVEETLQPLIYAGEDGRLEQPLRLRPPRELLALRVCDPAMGSGAFLVQTVRYLGEKLVDAWWAERDRHGEAASLYLPYAEPGGDRQERVPVPAERDEAETWARRLVAERCIYGVDKNSLAVEMAKLSLWLVTLSRERPFSFLDHALKSGDSLLGLSSLEQLRTWSLSGEGSKVYFTTERVSQAVALRREIQTLPGETPDDIAEKARLHADAETRLNNLKALADLLYSAALAEPAAKRQADLQATLLAAAVADLDDAEALTARARPKLGEHRPFHWPLEFPEVFDEKEPSGGGFDAFLGNPPYMGGQKITGAFGKPYREHLVRQLADGTRGSADLVVYFFLRAFQLLREGGNFGLLAVNTIAEGDTRQVGLERLARRRGVIYSAHPNEPWPNQAAVVTSRVHVHKGDWHGRHLLLGRQVPTVSAFLSDREEWTPKRLKANEGIAFIGSYVLGMGFTMSEEEALAMIDRDAKYRDVLFPYLNGKDLNTHPEQKPSRWVICFWDWPEERAREYEEAFRIVEEKVKPERMKVKRKARRERWWQFAELASGLYHAIGRGHLFERHPEGWDRAEGPLDRVICFSRHSRYFQPPSVSNSSIMSEATIILATGDHRSLALANSSVHSVWAWQQASRIKRDIRYTPTDCFETFPMPPWAVDALSEAGAGYEGTQRRLMLDHEQGLTATYNRFHDPADQDPEHQRLRELQVKLDQAVAAAYGWQDLDLAHAFHEVPYLPETDRLRFTISEPARLEILARLSHLNRERYQEEVDQGLHGDEKAARKKPKANAQAVATEAEPDQRPGASAAALKRRSQSIQPSLFDKGPRSSASARPAVPRPADCDLLAEELIRTWLAAHPGWHPRGEIVAALEISIPDWNRAILELTKSGRVERRGKKRGTRYRLEQQSG